jgi:hypothetical protein
MTSTLSALLVEERVVSFRQMDAAVQRQRTLGGRIGTALLELGHIDERHFREYLARVKGIPALEPEMVARVPASALRRMSRAQVKQFGALPFGDAGELQVGVVDILEGDALDELVELVRMPVRQYIVPEFRFWELIGHFHGAEVPPRFRDTIQQLGPWRLSVADDGLRSTGDGEVVGGRARQPGDSAIFGLTWTIGDLTHFYSECDDRDEMLEATLGFLGKFFPRRAVLAVGRDSVRGFSSIGFHEGHRPVSDVTLAVPPGSALGTLCAGESYYLGEPATVGLDALYEGVGADAPPYCAVLPVKVGPRAALLVVGDSGASETDPRLLAMVFMVLAQLSSALSRLILQQKRGKRRATRESSPSVSTAGLSDASLSRSSSRVRLDAEASERSRILASLRATYSGFQHGVHRIPERQWSEDEVAALSQSSLPAPDAAEHSNVDLHFEPPADDAPPAVELEDSRIDDNERTDELGTSIHAPEPESDAADPEVEGFVDAALDDEVVTSLHIDRSSLSRLEGVAGAEPPAGADRGGVEAVGTEAPSDMGNRSMRPLGPSAATADRGGADSVAAEAPSDMGSRSMRPLGGSSPAPPVDEPDADGPLAPTVPIAPDLIEQTIRMASLPPGAAVPASSAEAAAAAPVGPDAPGSDSDSDAGPTFHVVDYDVPSPGGPTHALPSSLVEAALAEAGVGDDVATMQLDARDVERRLAEPGPVPAPAATVQFVAPPVPAAAPPPVAAAQPGPVGRVLQPSTAVASTESSAPPPPTPREDPNAQSLRPSFITGDQQVVDVAHLVSRYAQAGPGVASVEPETAVVANPQIPPRAVEPAAPGVFSALEERPVAPRHPTAQLRAHAGGQTLTTTSLPPGLAELEGRPSGGGRTLASEESAPRTGALPSVLPGGPGTALMHGLELPLTGPMSAFSSPTVRAPGSSPSTAAMAPVVQPGSDALLQERLRVIEPAALVQAIVAGDPPVAEAALAVALERGDSVADAVMHTFPGPLGRGRRANVAAGLLIEAHGPLIHFAARYPHACLPRLRTLIDASDADTRFYAAQLLARFRDVASIPGLALRLFDRDEQVRLTALRFLEAYRADAVFAHVIQTVRTQLRSADAWAVEGAVALVLHFRDVGSIPLLIDLLDRGAPSTIQRAAQVLSRLTYQEFGTAARNWERWWRKAGNEDRRRWLVEAMVDANRAVRENAAREVATLPNLVVNYHPDLDKVSLKTAQRAAERYLFGR